LNPISIPKKLLQKWFWDRKLRLHPNWRGVTRFGPGHYYSPLLDIEALGPNDLALPFDGVEWWEHVDLRPSEQREYYDDLLHRFPSPSFSRQKTNACRYYTDNDFFGPGDAFTLSGIIKKEVPRRIIEIGSGFSSAVMLDTLDQAEIAASLTFIEPNPDRLSLLLSERDTARSTILTRRAQEVPLSVFDELEARDVLFIDSSHVCKIGSDVAFVLLRVLPRLRPGVLVHFHDIFYPFTYPVSWLREGRAWNESLVLRTFLMGNSMFEITAFNSYAAYSFAELFRERFPTFTENPGASLWLKKR
jgi:predicted O-methyltransferase YrrM